ncbi:cytochrome c biogenesis protein ResB [Baia soyae]|uniref:Cytochrome c biogenesis protein n=1 Tax=Baia soyae TaxID=1544746 RepID=A0A4R2S2H2_9BACL|nr:cytochrome c biogenesis protein ResB [Baia soyae]TCP69885.1 cytochrome c biogenesis protein [Baia soyae]
MVENTKCECGHNNPVGTILCEYCGKPLQQEVIEKSSIENEMRYEGAARRSQQSVMSLFDRVWAFFSSVKVAISLIVITLVLSAVGTIFPQEEFVGAASKELFYQQEYGWWGSTFYQLGLSKMYSQWWFASLIAMIGISLVICSLDRVVPLYKALKGQKVIKNIEFMKRQRIHVAVEVATDEEEAKLAELEQQLSKHHYHIQRDGKAILAEKGRFSRWGPYINHIGLIIFLFGILLRFIPGWNIDSFVNLVEGEIKRVPQTEYYVKNEKTVAEYYRPEELPPAMRSGGGQVIKKYQTDAILLKKVFGSNEMKEVTRHEIQVNDPLTYEGLNLLQSDFQPQQLRGIKLGIKDKNTKQSKGQFTVVFHDISLHQVYQVGDLKVKMEEYYPDFAIENQRPITKSREPNKPAFIFTIQKPDGKEEKSWVISGERLPDPEGNQYGIDLAGFDLANQTGLMVRAEKSLWVYLVGGIIFMIGVTMGSYWQHRRVWARVEDGVLYIGAHTNKNWFALRRELEMVGKPIGQVFGLVENEKE